MAKPILQIKNLTTSFATREGVIHAVDNATLDLEQGETLAIVGESGSGKTVLSLSLMNLIPSPPGKITNGSIFFKEQNLLELNEKELEKIRGNQISMIFQEPMTSLNPVLTIGNQVCESFIIHDQMSKSEAQKAALDILSKAGLPDASSLLNRYPHELSGGMRQRVMIAMALSCNPQILIADEPTTALDVTIQSQILDLISNMQKQINGSTIIITHDMGVVAKIADRVAVMYAGKIVECCDVQTIFKDPLHPYTKGLLASIPQLGNTQPLQPIQGTVPPLTNLPSGCRFSPRCPLCIDKCTKIEPELMTKAGHQVSCHRASEK